MASLKPSALMQAVREERLPGMEQKARNFFPEQVPRITAINTLSPRALERIKWMVPDFDKIKFKNSDAILDALDYFYDKLYSASAEELLQELSYQRRCSPFAEFPYSGEGTKVAFLKRMRFLRGKAPASLGPDTRHLYTACIALWAWRLPLPMYRPPLRKPVDKDLRAPRQTGVLRISDYDLIRRLEKMGPSAFLTEDGRFVEFNVHRVRRRPQTFSFTSLKDRVHAERLVLSDWDILTHLIRLVEVENTESKWYGWQTILVADLAWRGYLRGPERFRLNGVERDQLHRIFERVALFDERHVPENGQIFKAALLKFASCEREASMVIAGEVLPAQRCLTSGGVSNFDPFVVEAEFEVIEDLKPQDKAMNLSLLTPEILRDPEPVPVPLFDLSPPPPQPWDGEAKQMGLF